ncbi:MAG: MBL fold metallo-hydrolase [Gemmatimonadales bacterium]|nr:MBL fold metallo-hydrolase [Gemmatimonadales bacterium]NIN11052.1 MBL fold metallo-hydrolase [Gemmatimonadales bacterium]NIN49649.1 MBL fold metallo-hydrolase [Gemmatimonadales bacterium]NIP07113.1 MBL fold metallo-hydrolase [Gemmatimonadales bacterium]NIQ99504.1 MBL fold metallo-hydrolase [Gemmatimonadales bacterium]
MAQNHRSVQFLGAAGTVTGSKHLVTVGGQRVLLDCGMFQGLKRLRLRNWSEPPVDPGSIDAVVLSHAHIDHTGYLPVLVRNGFSGPVLCTGATGGLLGILLRDAAHLQEEQAEHLNRRGRTKHRPALPLFTRVDADAALGLLKARPYQTPFEVADGVTALFRTAGHILGSASIELSLDGKKPIQVAFSGDLGRWDRPILHDPELIPHAEYLLVESTYGNRMHEADPDEDLAAIVRRSADRGHAILIPAFAVGRTQELLWRLRQLEDDGRIPKLPVYMDSPMAIDVTKLYRRRTEEHDPDMRRLMEAGEHPLRPEQFRFARGREESIALNDVKGPVIIISASGMATGGRILHHMKLRLPQRRTTVLLVGFQAAGTRGRALQDGARQVRIHGRDVPVRAKVHTLHGLSAHADQRELLRWLAGFEHPPNRTYLVHGEPGASDTLAGLITDRLGWSAVVAEDGERVQLT